MSLIRSMHPGRCLTDSRSTYRKLNESSATCTMIDDFFSSLDNFGPKPSDALKGEGR